MVKIDVEGGELDVLCGAREMMRISRPRFFLEAHGAELVKACSQQLLQLGYQIHCIEREMSCEESVRHLICLQ